jgi:D-cysteine desulfhydrase
MQQLADKVSAAGGHPYIISGSNACGISSLGYVDCAQELIAQFTDKNLDIETIIVPSGSGGTHGGLLAGLWANGFDHINVLGINVRRNKKLQCERINKVLQDINKVLGLKITIPKSAVNCFDDYLGPGYSIPSAETIEAIELLARYEGILLDPVYSGKTMAGLIDLVRKNKFKTNENVLFLHSGGVPALYAYKDLFLKKAGDKRDERV